MKRLGMLCLVLLALAGSTSQAADSSGHTWIAYVKGANWGTTSPTDLLYLLDPDDGTTRLLLNANEQLGEPTIQNLSWSGSQFVFETPSGLYLLDLDGNLRRILTGLSEFAIFPPGITGPMPFPAKRMPLWSPDGRWIALMIASGDGETPNAFRLYLLDTRLPGEQTLDDLRLVGDVKYDDGFTLPGFSWSPDGQKLLFLDPYGGGTVFHVLDVATGTTTTAYIAGQEQIEDIILPVWSPDGEWIAFRAYNSDAGQDNVYRMHPDGSDVQALITGEFQLICCQPVWSPDGQWIVQPVQVPQEDTYTLYRMRADGSDPQMLPTQGGGFRPIAWSPDGQWIAYFSLSEESLYRVRANGTEESQLLVAAEGVAITSLAWFSAE